MWSRGAQAWLSDFWDIDENGVLDLVFCCNAGQSGIWAYDHHGTLLLSCTNWGDFVRLEDMDGDGEVEFLTRDGNTVRCINADCSEEWSYTLPGSYAHPVAVDADGIGEREVLIGLHTGNYLCMLRGGEVVWEDWAPGGVNRFRFPEDLGDMTGDGLTDLIVGNDARHIYMYTNRTAGSLQAELDIKPGSCPNPLNARSQGRLPVAILGTASMDVHDIDSSSLRLESVAPVHTGTEDVSTPIEGEPCECTSEGPDGLLDLTLKFDTQDVVAALGPVVNGEERVLTLTGLLLDGTPFEARDCVRLHVPGATAAREPVLCTAHPNPFNPVTRIAYTLPASMRVSLCAYDASGRLVDRLVDRLEFAGDHVVEWDAGLLPSGNYFIRLETGREAKVERVTLIK
jgi:hypothetical protein